MNATPAVLMTDGRATVLSTDVARHFGKRHTHVLRAIQNLECSDAYRQPNFGLTIQDVAGPKGAIRKEPVYQITRDGFAFLAMGFTGQEAARWKEAYINAFNQLEKAHLQRLQTLAEHVEPVPGIKHLRGKMSLAQTFKLYEQSHKTMRLLLAEPSLQGCQNLYWQLRQINDTLGIPTAPLAEIVVVKPVAVALTMTEGAADRLLDGREWNGVPS